MSFYTKFVYFSIHSFIHSFILHPSFYLLSFFSFHSPAAVPSKRDMLTLVKAIQLEISMAISEGDVQGGLVRAVCKEAVKAIQLVRKSIFYFFSTFFCIILFILLTCFIYFYFIVLYIVLSNLFVLFLLIL